MPVSAPSNGHSTTQHRRVIATVAQPAVRPHRKSVFHNPDWPPAPDREFPTPAIIRAARARALSASTDMAPKPSAPTAAAPAAETAAAQSAPKQPRAQQMQARALAAQAAHQQRLAASLAVSKLPSPVPARRPVSFLASYQFGRTFGTVDPSALVPDIDTLPSATELGPAFSYPSLNAEDTIDMMDEIQVDLSLPLTMGSPSLDEHVQFTSPSATVDISAFLPPPGPPVLVANDATVAASAVPLGDWAADLCWSLISRSLSPRMSAAQEQAKWFADIAGPRDAQASARTTGAACPAFRAYVNSTLAATLPSPQCLFLGFLYLSKLPIGNFRSVPRELDNAFTPPGVLALFASLNAPSWSLHECEFREILYGKGNVYSCIAGDAADDASLNVAQLVITLALMLGNKWLEDNTFTTRTWHDVTALPQAHIKSLETAALNIFGFSLIVQDSEWHAWLSVLRSRTSNLVTREPIGVVGTTNGLALARVDSLLQAVPRTDTSTRVSFLLNDDDDIVLVPHAHVPARLVVGHAAYHLPTTSLPTSDGGTASDLFSRYVTQDSGPTAHSSPLARAQGMSYGWGPRQDGDELDPFQFHAPHPAVASAAMDARRRANQQQIISTLYPEPVEAPCYHWDQVQAEMVAREREQELFVSTWPRPSRMDWSNSWARPSVIGM